METPSDATYWEELYRIAKDLKKNDKGFWKSFTELGALVGWLHYRGKCAYCQRELVQEGQLIGGAGTTDHLLPITRFPKLGFKSPFNVRELELHKGVTGPPNSDFRVSQS
jgi:hypothetical protein